VPEVDRMAISADIAKRLNDPSFRAILSSTAPDGSTPIIPALRSDILRDVLVDVNAAGGAGNVVVPIANGYMVIALKAVAAVHSRAKQPPALDPRQTVGVLMARLIEDGGVGATLTYRIKGLGPNARPARADLLGIAA